MNILIAPDKFKDAISAEEAAKAMERGVRRAFPFNPEIRTRSLPLADGGEGTASILTRMNRGKMRTSLVAGPLKEQINASWGYVLEKELAFIELAEASGLHLIPLAKRNPLHTSTYGTGQLIGEALQAGASKIVLGLGGSATNEGGAGMASALGYRFLDAQGNEISFLCGKDLVNIRSIDASGIHPLLKTCKIEVACDVDNPLLGPSGATYTFARQKGAEEDVLPFLEEGLQNLAEVLRKDLGVEVSTLAGSGAAGGCGAGVVAFLGGELSRGADLILEHSNFDHYLRKADLLLTGEGKLDSTSLGGKLISRLCEKAGKAKVPVIAFCGSCEISEEQIQSSGLEAAIPISSKKQDLMTALRNTSSNLEEAVYFFFLNGLAC